MHHAPAIPFAIDTATNLPVAITPLLVELFFPIQELRTRCRAEPGAFVCPECHSPLAVHTNPGSGRNPNHNYHFQHLPGTGIDCRFKTNSEAPGHSEDAIREGVQHAITKTQIAALLARLPGWQVLSVDSRFVFSMDRASRAKPDIHAQYKGRDVAIEVQMFADSVSLIAARNEHYLSLGWPHLWLLPPIDGKAISQAGADSPLWSHLRQLHKDMPGMSHGNFFSITDECVRESVSAGILMLNCNYLKVTDTADRFIWSGGRISADDLQWTPGAIHYLDAASINSAIVSKAVILVAKELLTTHARTLLSFDDFLSQIRTAVPMYDAMLPEASTEAYSWLKAQFFHTRSGDLLRFKQVILKLFRQMEAAPNDRGVISTSTARWAAWARSECSSRAGIIPLTQLDVIRDLLLIMGYSLSEAPRQKPIEALIRFLDAKPEKSILLRGNTMHITYWDAQDAAALAVMASTLSDELLNDQQMTPRRSKALSSPNVSGLPLRQFVIWMLSEPLLPVTTEAGITLSTGGN